MSRTDAHRPRWVQLNDHPELARETHCHTNGVCDLLDDDGGVAVDGAPDYLRSLAGRCYAELDWSVRTCSCWMCHAGPERRRAVRRRRAAERAFTLAAVRSAGEEELDRLEGRLWLAGSEAD